MNNIFLAKVIKSNQIKSNQISLLVLKSRNRIVTNYIQTYIILNIQTANNLNMPGIFLAILGRGPRAFLIGKISDVNPEFGKFSGKFKIDNIFQVDIVNQAYAFRIINNGIKSNLNSISNSRT